MVKRRRSSSDYETYHGSRLNIGMLLVVTVGLLLVVIVVLGLYNLLGWIFPKTFIPVPQQITFAGRIVSESTHEWPNDRLVLVFLKGKEVGRSITKLGEFAHSHQGIHDGLFIATVPNTYGLRNDSFKTDKVFGPDFYQPRRAVFFRAPYMYHWFNTVPDDGVIHLPVLSKPKFRTLTNE